MLIQTASYNEEDASSILVNYWNIRFGKWALRCSILLLFWSTIESSLNQENFNADLIIERVTEPAPIISICIDLYSAILQEPNILLGNKLIFKNKKWCKFKNRKFPKELIIIWAH